MHYSTRLIQRRRFTRALDWSRRLPRCSAYVLFAVVCVVASGEPPEKLLRDLITDAQSLPLESDSLAARAGRVDNQLEQHQLRSVVRSIRALSLLHAGEVTTARAILEELASGSRDDAGNNSARVLLSLMDRDQIVAALKQFYGRHLRYPASLDELRREFPDRNLPQRDRWGDPWNYRLTAPRFFQVGEAQTYQLSSRHIPNLADLSKALAKPYGRDLQGITVSRVIQTPGDRGAIVAFSDEQSGQSFTLSEGAGDESRWFLAWIGDWIFISDGLHFHSVAAPR